MAYESKTEEAIVVTPARELEVKEFNKKEIEEIAKSVCEPRLDIDNPFYGVETVDTNSTNEFFAAIDDGKLPLSNKSDLTDEQMKKLLTIMKKAINGKVVNYAYNEFREFLCLNYVQISDASLICCFGCYEHLEAAKHVEYRLNLSQNSFTCNISEV